MSMEWILAFAAAGLVVLVVAILLLTIIALCVRIRGLAGTALGVVREIEEKTRPIWGLSTTNKLALELLAGARAIDGNARAIADTLTQADKNRAA
jgi:hypothetical protein